jgi:predicted nucleic acid-binding protein
VASERTSATTTALDTSVIISGLLSWHEDHEAASAALIGLFESGDEVILPLHSLIEAYAVMTRLPPPHRLSAKEALDVLEGSLRSRSSLIAFSAKEGWGFLKELSRRNLVGGTTYDSLILASARQGGAHRLLTFNRAHFERVGAEDIEIVVPSRERHH